MNTIDQKDEVRLHFNNIAGAYDAWKNKNTYYYSLIKDFYKSQIPKGSCVLELGCATGDILASCRPKRGLGIDISEEMICLARQKYPQYEFRVSDAEKELAGEGFGFVIMSDLLDHVSRIARVFAAASSALAPAGKLICTTINPFWGPVLNAAENLKFKMREGPHSFVTIGQAVSACKAVNLRVIDRGFFVFFPKKIPFIAQAFNKIMPHVPLCNRLCWVQFLIAQK